MEEGASVVAAWDFVWAPRYQLAHGWCKQCNQINLLAAKVVCKKERRENSHLREKSLILLTVEKGVWVAAASDCIGGRALL